MQPDAHPAEFDDDGDPAGRAARAPEDAIAEAARLERARLAVDPQVTLVEPAVGAARRSDRS